MFKKAAKYQSRLRLSLTGPSGSGKTYTALSIATAMGERVAVLDTEHGSAAKYADLFSFDVVELDRFAPQEAVKVIHEAERQHYDILVIDSLSHFWMGKGGALEMKDDASRKYRGNSWAAWADVTPHHNALIDAMIRTDLHLIVTMRARTSWVIENEGGKQTPRKVGLEPIQRDGMDYEVDIAGDMTLNNELIITKTRYSGLHGAVIPRPDAEFAETLQEWLTQGNPFPPCVTCGRLVRPEAAAVVEQYAGVVLCAEHWQAFKQEQAKKKPPPQ